MRSGQIASVGTKAHGLAYVGRRAQNPRPIGLRPYKIVRARLKNGVAGLVAGPGPHDTTTSEARMAQTDQSDLARRLVKLLREYGLPATTTAFSVHVALDDIVRVDCKFLAVGDPRPTN